MTTLILSVLLALHFTPTLVQGNWIRAENGTYYDNENEKYASNVIAGWVITLVVLSSIFCCCVAGAGLTYTILRKRRNKAALAAGNIPSGTFPQASACDNYPQVNYPQVPRPTQTQTTS